MLRFFLVSLVCLVLAACGRQPDEALIRSDVERVLDLSFGEGTFQVVDFARRGTAVDSTAPEGERRRVAYYDIEMELSRDLALGDWEDPRAASLVTLLGAGPRSIEGVKTGGNVAGDRIVAHASAIYREEEDGWVFVMPAGFNEQGRARLEAGTQKRPAQDALHRLGEIMRSVEAGGSQMAKSVVDSELQRSVARLSGRLSRIEQGYPLAAGAAQGEYAAFAQALAVVSNKHQLSVVPLVSGGSEENLELLRNGSAVLALVQADIAYAAHTGTGLFAAQGPFRTLLAVGSLYPEYVHIVVNRAAGLQTAADLKGARVAMGPEGSAVRNTLKRVLAAHGLEEGRDYEAVGLRMNEALPMLKRGDLDAVAHVIGLPAAPLRDALDSGEGGLALLPLDEPAIRRLSSGGDGTLAATIGARMYPEQHDAVATVAVPALLLTTEDLSADEVARIVHSVYDNGNDLLAQGSAQGSQVSVRTARRGLTVPLHAGAKHALGELELPAESRP